MLGLFIGRSLRPSGGSFTLPESKTRVAWVSYRTYYRELLFVCSRLNRTDVSQAPLSHPHCHLPLAPRSPEEEEEEDGDEETGEDEQSRNHRVRLLPEEMEPRASEEQVAWRRSDQL